VTTTLLTLALPILWLLFCLRFWLIIGRQNPGQRHLIAIGAGLGAALFYWIAHFTLHLLAPSTLEEHPTTPLDSTEIRIHSTKP